MTADRVAATAANPSEARLTLRFGACQLVVSTRRLLVDGKATEIGGRAFELLLFLLEARGTLVTKQQILDRVWPGISVDQNNVHAQISTLRRALGKDGGAIRNESGRGYRFIAPIERIEFPAHTSNDEVADSHLTNLPARVSELIAREEELADLASMLARHRLVTLSGPGGIGKTRLAVEAARRGQAQFPDGVWFVELAQLTDPELLAATIEASLPYEHRGPARPVPLAERLAARSLLLVLDNCEHLVEAVAPAVEQVLFSCPSVRVLATSREPLRAEGEHVFPVPPLPVPPADTDATTSMLSYGAVRLLFDRANASAPLMVPDRRLAQVAGAICRRLDGIPLAIELAASRAGTLGLDEIAARLDDRFRLLANGATPAASRHQTLRATLDWSYQLLSEPERCVLQRLAIFTGSFTLDAASDVAADGHLPAAVVVDCIAGLVMKSLLLARPRGTEMRYRMLETTRAYALEKLHDSGERTLTARRHAGYYQQLFARAEHELVARPSQEWVSGYADRIDDLRAALEWCFSPEGDGHIGVLLTASAVPLWFQLSLMDECSRRVQRALAALPNLPASDGRCEMQLLAAFGMTLTHTKGLVPEAEAAWNRLYALAEERDDATFQLQALHGMWSFRNNSGDLRVALSLAERFFELAQRNGSPADRLTGHRMTGVPLHFLGDQAAARQHIEQMLSGNLPPLFRPNTLRSLLDHRARSLSTLARILWLQGFPDQATEAANAAVAKSLGAVDQAISLCYVLAQAAIPLALLTGDQTTAKRHVNTMLAVSGQHGLRVWQTRAQCFEGVLRIAHGDFAGGLKLVQARVQALQESQSALYCMGFLAVLADTLGRCGNAADGMAWIEQGIGRSGRLGERWCIAELLRIRASLVLRHSASNAVARAEADLQASLAWARRQDALSWELRTATDLARLWHRHHRTDDARRLLWPVYSRFTEGFATFDLKAAKRLLDAIMPACQPA